MEASVIPCAQNWQLWKFHISMPCRSTLKVVEHRPMTNFHASNEQGLTGSPMLIGVQLLTTTALFKGYILKVTLSCAWRWAHCATIHIASLVTFKIQRVTQMGHNFFKSSLGMIGACPKKHHFFLSSNSIKGKIFRCPYFFPIYFQSFHNITT